MNSIQIKQVLLALAALCLSPWASADTYTYDGLNRLTSVIYSSGPQISYSYDAAGNRTAMTSSALTAPNAFSFTPQTGVALNTQVVSNAITVAGINTATAITVTGGEYSIAGAAYTTDPGNVSSGQGVTVRLTSAATNNTLLSATLTIGGVSASFNVTTVGKINQTIGVISFVPTTLVVGGTTTASATGGASGNAVTFSSTSLASICTVSSGGLVTGVGVGTCAVTANQAGSTSYQAASPVTQNITVNPTPAPGISLAPASLTFADQHIGSTSAVKTVVLTNTGGAALTIATIAPSIDVFAVNHNCPTNPATLAASASCNLNVTFTPVAIGTRAGAITVTSNAAGSTPSVIVSGVGVASNVPICALTAVPATIRRGGSSVLTASCNPVATSYAWTGGTCAGTSASICNVAPGVTTVYGVTGTNDFGAGFASATVTLKAIDLTPILILLLD